jgi:hypothetical protein
VQYKVGDFKAGVIMPSTNSNITILHLESHQLSYFLFLYGTIVL